MSVQKGNKLRKTEGRRALGFVEFFSFTTIKFMSEEKQRAALTFHCRELLLQLEQRNHQHLITRYALERFTMTLIEAESSIIVPVCGFKLLHPSPHGFE